MVKFLPHADFQTDLTGHSFEGGGGKLMDLFDGDTGHSPMPFRNIDTSLGYPNYRTLWDVAKGIRFLIDLQNGDDTAAKPVIQRLRYFDYSAVSKHITFRNADAAFDGTTSGSSAAARKTKYKTLVGLTSDASNIIHQYTTAGSIGSAFTQVDISNVSCRFLLIQFENLNGAISELEIYLSAAAPAGVPPVYVDDKPAPVTALLNRMGFNDSEGNLALSDFKGGRVYRRYNSKGSFSDDTTHATGSRTVNLAPYAFDYEQYIVQNYGAKIISSFRGKHAYTGTPPNTTVLSSNQILGSSPVDETAADPENPDNYTEDFHLVYCLNKKYGSDASAPTLPYRINNDSTPGTYGLNVWQWFEDGNEDEGQGSYTPLSQFARMLGNQVACKSADPNMRYVMGGSVFMIDEYFKTFAFLCKWFAPSGLWLWDAVNIHEYYNGHTLTLGGGSLTLEQKVGIKALRPENGDWQTQINNFRLNISRFIGTKANTVEWFISEFGADTYPNGPVDTTEAGNAVTVNGTPIYGTHTPQESQAITLLRYNLHILAAKIDYAIQYQVNNFFNVPDSNKILFATMGLLQDREQPSGPPWAVPGSGATSTKKPSWYFYAQLETHLSTYKLINRLQYDATGLNVYKFQDVADPTKIALYCYKGSEDGTGLTVSIPVLAASLNKITFSFTSETATQETKSVADNSYTDNADERGFLLKYNEDTTSTAPNLVGNEPRIVVAKTDVSFLDAGLSTINTRVVYKVGPSLDSWRPERGINGITGFEKDQGYYVVAKEDMDLSAFLIPPLDTGGTPVIDAISDESGGGLQDESGVNLLIE
jgi:hypothetical protein